jgi:hypothetical protein
MFTTNKINTFELYLSVDIDYIVYNSTKTKPITGLWLYISFSDYSFSMKYFLPSCFSQPQQQSPIGAAGGDLFLDFLTNLMVVPCALCKEKVANAKFIPCGHKLVCERCSLRFDVCPKCKSRVQARVDNRKCIFASVYYILRQSHNLDV